MFGKGDPARGKALVALRQAKPMTQGTLAMAAGLSPQTVKRAEAGKPVTAETVLALCSALGTTPEALSGAAAREGTAVPDQSVAGTPGAASAPGTWWGKAYGSAHWHWALLVVAAGFEAFAWTPLASNPIAFRFYHLQALGGVGMCLVALAWNWLSDHSAERRTDRGLARWAALALGVAMLGTGIVAKVQLSNYADAMERTQEADLANWHAHSGMVDIMAARDPGYDRTLDDWYLGRELAAIDGVSVADQETPGRWKARNEADARCAKEWLRSPAFDHAACDARVETVAHGRLGEFARMIRGEPCLDREPIMRAAVYFAGSKFAPARKPTVARKALPGGAATGDGHADAGGREAPRG